MSIQKKLFMGYLIVLLLIGIMAFYGIHMSERSLKETVGRNSITSAQRMLNRMTFRIDGIIDDVDHTFINGWKM